MATAAPRLLIAFAKKLLLALLLGAPIALLLALGLAIFVPLTKLPVKRVVFPWPSDPTIPEGWQSDERVGFGVREIRGASATAQYQEGGLAYWNGSEWKPKHLMPDFAPQSFELYRVESGFPFPALEATLLRAEPHWTTGASSSSGSISGRARISWRSPMASLVIPLRPMLLGLLLDALVFGIALLLVQAFWRFRRARARARRGKCRGCGYPREEGAVCPECGRSAL